VEPESELAVGAGIAAYGNAPSGTHSEADAAVGAHAMVSAPEPGDASQGAPAAAPRFQLGWAARYACGNLGAGLMFAFANAALPLYLASYGLPNAVIGLLAQDRPPLAGVSQIVVGALSDRTRSRFGRRKPYLLGGVPVAAAALLVLSLRPQVWVAIAVLVVMTTSLAVAYGPYLALLADLVASELRGRVGGLQAAANMLGQMTMLWVAAQFWSDHEALVFGIGAVGLVVAFSVTFFGVREPPIHDSPAPIRIAPMQYVRGILAQREVAKYLLATLFYWLGAGGVVPFLTRFGVNELHTDETTAFQLLMVPVIATVIFTWPAGWLGDRCGKKPVLFAGLVLMGGAVLIGSQVQSVAQAAAILVVTGAANALCTVLLFPLLTDLLPKDRAGEFTGLGAGVWELAQPLGAVLGGLAADMTGTLRATLEVAALLTFVAAALLLRVRTPAPVRA
jgi:maltose/moltooligosaccharide transporter